MKSWEPERIAAAAGAKLIGPPPGRSGPERVTIDSRDAGPNALFIGLPGAKVDGGRFAAQALAAGAWGVLTAPDHVEAARCAAPGVLLAAGSPLIALQRLATAWRRELGAQVIGVTGSTGKTSTKDLLLAVLEPHRRTFASRANFNTEIGLPLEILAAPPQTEVMVLEMGMRGTGQIAELAAIAEPDVAVIVSIGPVHLELLGTVEAVAAAKAELIDALASGGTAVVPVNEPLLAPHLRDDLDVVTFGSGGDVELLGTYGDRLEIGLRAAAPGCAVERIELEFAFPQAHLRTNLLAAVAAARAVGVRAEGRIEPELSAGRGQRVALPGGVTLIDDCYNANPMSTRAALDDLAASARAAGGARRVAVLGDMLELGQRAREYHAEVGQHAQAVGIDVLVTVGPLAAAIAERFEGQVHAVSDSVAAARLVPALVAPGDFVLVKGSRGMALELVCDALAASVSA